MPLWQSPGCNVTFINYFDFVSSKFATTFLGRNDNPFRLKIQAAFARTCSLWHVVSAHFTCVKAIKLGITFDERCTDLAKTLTFFDKNVCFHRES